MLPRLQHPWALGTFQLHYTLLDSRRLCSLSLTGMSLWENLGTVWEEKPGTKFGAFVSKVLKLLVKKWQGQVSVLLPLVCYSVFHHGFGGLCPKSGRHDALGLWWEDWVAKAGSVRGANCLLDDCKVKGIKEEDGVHIKEEDGVPQSSSRAHTQRPTGIPLGTMSHQYHPVRLSLYHMYCKEYYSNHGSRQLWS